MKYLVLILCSIFSSVCVLQAQSYNEIVEQAMECVKKDSLVQAEQLFRKALKLEPNNARNALLFPIWELCRNVWERRMRPLNRTRWR